MPITGREWGGAAPGEGVVSHVLRCRTINLRWWPSRVPQERNNTVLAQTRSTLLEERRGRAVIIQGRHLPTPPCRREQERQERLARAQAYEEAAWVTGGGSGSESGEVRTASCAWLLPLALA